jgi:SAM-dependent methyltransferase
MPTTVKEYPNWKSLALLESSPGNRGRSVILKRQAKKYTETQFYVNEMPGIFVNGVCNEDLENHTFKNVSFDLLITSDVMEHIYEPEKAFKEINKTLKPNKSLFFQCQ